MRRRQRNTPVDIPFEARPLSLVRIKGIFVMDEHRHTRGKQAPRHDRIDRAPIIAEHEIETPHVARKRLIARDRRAAANGWAIGGEINANVLGDATRGGGGDGLVRRAHMARAVANNVIGFLEGDRAVSRVTRP